jgi:hypothetical protein
MIRRPLRRRFRGQVSDHPPGDRILTCDVGSRVLSCEMLSRPGHDTFARFGRNKFLAYR